MADRRRSGLRVLGLVVLVLVLVACDVGRSVTSDGAPVYGSYAGTGSLPAQVVVNPTSPQPFRCRVNQPATHDVGQCGPAHYQGRGIAVALPVACTDWLQANWVPGATIDQASDASVVVRDPVTDTVLASEPDLMDLAWGLRNPGGIYGSPMWPAHVYFTTSGVGRLVGGSTAMGWTYDTPRLPALASYRTTISCVTGVDGTTGRYVRSVTTGAIAAPA